MRFRSAAVKGCASGSESAARSIARGVIGRIPLRVLLEVELLFMLCRPPGRYNSDSLFSLRINHKEKVIVNHTDNHETLFAIIMPVIEKLDGKRVFK